MGPAVGMRRVVNVMVKLWKSFAKTPPSGEFGGFCFIIDTYPSFVFLDKFNGIATYSSLSGPTFA